MRYKRQSAILQACRTTCELTQSEVAKKLKVNTQHYGSWELGKTRIPPEYVKVLEKLFNEKIIWKLVDDIGDDYARQAGFKP